MYSEPDGVVGELLRSDSDYSSLYGRLMLSFGQIEEQFIHDARFLAEQSESHVLSAEAEPSRLARLQTIERRDFLKRTILETSRFYGLARPSILDVLNEFTNIYKVRRVVVHGAIRWSPSEERPEFTDNRGVTVPAWHHDLANLNIRLLNWSADYYTEMAALHKGVLNAYDEMADRLLARVKSPWSRALVEDFKKHVSAGLK